MTRAVAILLLICAGAQAQTAPRPYKDARKDAAVFTGPGANEPEPTVKEILFGWFGPAEGPMWDAANHAIGEANRHGGYKGLPFRLVSGWAADPWRAGALHVTRMVFRDRVWALIAAANGDAVHLAEQVAVKALGVYKSAAPPEFLKKNNQTLQERRDLLVDTLCDIGFTCEKPKATFYVWVNCKGDSMQFATKLLNVGVAVTPGVGFGKHGEGYARITFTQPKERIMEACNRIASAF